MAVRSLSLLPIASILFTGCLLASSKESRAAGEAVYHASTCERCHGAKWTGTDRGPDLRGVGTRMQREEIEKQIRAGGDGMPAFGDLLSDTQLVQLVDFLEAQKKAPPPTKSGSNPVPQPDKPKSSEPESHF